MYNVSIMEVPPSSSRSITIPTSRYQMLKEAAKQFYRTKGREEAHDTERSRRDAQTSLEMNVSDTTEQSLGFLLRNVNLIADELNRDSNGGVRNDRLNTTLQKTLTGVVQEEVLRMRDNLQRQVYKALASEQSVDARGEVNKQILEKHRSGAQILELNAPMSSLDIELQNGYILSKTDNFDRPVSIFRNLKLGNNEASVDFDLLRGSVKVNIDTSALGNTTIKASNVDNLATYEIVHNPDGDGAFSVEASEHESLFDPAKSFLADTMEMVELDLLKRSLGASSLEAGQGKAIRQFIAHVKAALIDDSTGQIDVSKASELANDRRFVAVAETLALHASKEGETDGNNHSLVINDLKYNNGEPMGSLTITSKTAIRAIAAIGDSVPNKVTIEFTPASEETEASLHGKKVDLDLEKDIKLSKHATHYGINGSGDDYVSTALHEAPSSDKLQPVSFRKPDPFKISVNFVTGEVSIDGF